MKTLTGRFSPLALCDPKNGLPLQGLAAGFAENVLNIRGVAFKRGRELAQHLARLCNLPEETVLEDAAEEFIERFRE